MPASADLNDGLAAAINLMVRGEVIDIVIALEAVREDVERLVDQPVVERSDTGSIRCHSMITVPGRNPGAGLG